MNMAKFNPILKKPGEIIRSEDWNKIQQDMLEDIEELETKLRALKDYVDNMEESATMLSMDSTIGKAYALDEVLPGETSSYRDTVVGILSKQWLLQKGVVGDICKFSVVSQLETLDYWSGAENGNKKTLEITFNYIDGTSAIKHHLSVKGC